MDVFVTVGFQYHGQQLTVKVEAESCPRPIQSKSQPNPK